jgi:tetratricopeptide (TPR) repeat protein
MVRSLIYCLSALTIISCTERAWFKKEISAEEKKKLARQFSEGAARYYQGSVANMMLLEEGVRMDSTLPELWRELATPYLKRGLPNEAFRYYAKEVSLAPELWQGWRGYLYLYFYHDYNRAIADFNATDTLTTITDYPQGQSVDYMRGLCYYGLHDYTKAITFFDKYIEEVTREKGEEWVDTYAFLYRGLTREKLQQFIPAIDDFETGLKYDHRLADFHYHITRVSFEDLHLPTSQITAALDRASLYYRQGYFHQRDYVEVHDELYLEDIENLKQKVSLQLH